MSNDVKKVLWIGDAGCPSGFARGTHEIVDIVSQHYDVTVLAINYRGDPPIDPKTGLVYRYPMYSAGAAGQDGRYDSLGVSRLHWMCHHVKPDVIVIQNDGWFIPHYIRELRRREPSGEYTFPDHAAIPIVAAVAVDGKNFQGKWIQDLTLAIFWTNFALKEARAGGYTGPAKVIPLGVDLETYYPDDRRAARERKQATGLEGSFVVGNVNRNQPRKRWDLLVKYFAEWVHSRNIADAKLYFHSAPTGDESFNILQLAEHYGILNRLAWCQPEVFYGEPEDRMRDTYNLFDVYATTTQGEGMGLTTLEAMACCVPCILPDWSALGDWAKGAAMLVPCTTTALQNPGLTVIGGVVDQRLFIEALDLLYRDKERYAEVANWGYKRVQQPHFRWQSIGREWVKTLDALFAQPAEQNTEIWQDLKSQAQPVDGRQKGQAEAPSQPTARPDMSVPSQPGRLESAVLDPAFGGPR